MTIKEEEEENVRRLLSGGRLLEVDSWAQLSLKGHEQSLSKIPYLAVFYVEMLIFVLTSIRI